MYGIIFSNLDKVGVFMETVKILANFNENAGREIKPMHGVGQPPILGGPEGVGPQLFHYLEEAGIPYARLHDTGGRFGGGIYVDIPNIFRDFDADVNDPASYDFTFTDILIKDLLDYKVETVYRLGVTIENAAEIKTYHVKPPKDFQKWAEICEHVIRHYNEGWADGYHFGIKYWEIWNEPDIPDEEAPRSMTWQGTNEQFFKFYEIASKHIKKCFGDSIAIGGYAAIGFTNHEIHDPDLSGNITEEAKKADGWAHRLNFFHKFLQHVKENNCPFDFFSWHCYAITPEKIVDREKYCRAIMKKYGFENVPDFLNEWNTWRKEPKMRATAFVAANTFSVMLAMQKTETYMLNYYDARIGQSVYGGMFNPDTYEPYKTYYAFQSFNTAYKLGTEIVTDSDNNEVYVLGARNDKKGVILIANIGDEEAEFEFDVKGANINDGEVIMTDDQYLYTYRGEIIKENKLQVKAHSCIEIKLTF